VPSCLVGTVDDATVCPAVVDLFDFTANPEAN
jgi:hypothetical protein